MKMIYVHIFYRFSNFLLIICLVNVIKYFIFSLHISIEVRFIKTKYNKLLGYQVVTTYDIHVQSTGPINFSAIATISLFD